MRDYFFSGNQYIRVTRGDTGPGVVDAGYPRTISPNWGWGSFGANGIDAALYSGSKCYFFAGGEYIRVTRGVTGPGTIDPGYPRPIAPNWGWGAFGANGIDAALYSNSKCYFFSGKEYIRVTRGETGPGTVDAGYPRPISVWGWGSFGANGIDAALYSGSRCYFFSGDQYIRVTRADEGAGTVDAGYPKPISPNWGWGSFGNNGISAALNSGGPYAAIPEQGLGSNSNYFLYSPAEWVSVGARAALERRPGIGVPVITSCNHLLGLSVHIIVDTDITGTNGFGFQINAYSASGEYDGAQQYVVLLIPNSSSPSLTCVVNNWHSKQQWVISHRGLAGQPAKQYAARRIPDHHDPVERRGRQHHRCDLCGDRQPRQHGRQQNHFVERPARTEPSPHRRLSAKLRGRHRRRHHHALLRRGHHDLHRL